MNKEIINKRIYKLIGNLSKVKIYPDDELHIACMETIESFINDVENMKTKTFDECFTGGFKQLNVKDNEVEVPAFVLLDVLIGYVDKCIINCSGNVLQKRKAEAIKALKSIRNRTTILEHDERFNRNFKIENYEMKTLVSSRGNFSFTFKKPKEVDSDFSILPQDELIPSYSATIYYPEYVTKNGKLEKTKDDGEYEFEGILFFEDRKALGNEYIKRINDYKSMVRAELTSLFNGVLPGSYEEASKLLKKHEGDFVEDYDFYELVFVAYKFLEGFHGKDTISKIEELLSILKQNKKETKNPKIKPATKEKKTKKNGLFARTSDDVKLVKTDKAEETKSQIFNLEKQKQELKDNEVIETIILQRKVVNGKETIVQLDPKEYKVVRK